MTQITKSYKDARRDGDMHYFTGKACVRGHVALRRTSTRACVLCAREATKNWRDANLARSSELRKAAYRKDAERQRERSLKWYHENGDKARERMRDAAKSDPARRLARFREWAAENKGRIAAHAMKRHAAKLKRTPRWANLAAIAAFYEACPVGMQVDHVIPLQGRLVSGLHVLNNLQYLAKTDNIAKGNKFDPWTFIA